MTVPPVTNPTKPSITFVITSLFRGGAETQMVRVALSLAKRGWRVRIVTLMNLDDFGAALSSNGIEVRTLGIPRGRYDPRALPALVRILREQAPDVVCTFMYHANVIGRVAARLAGRPVVVSSIRNAVFGGWVADKLIRLTDGLAAVTTTNSELAAKQLLARGVTRRDRLMVVRNAVEPNPPTQARARDELVGRALGSSWLWLSVGRLEPQKAHENELKALALLLGEGHDLHLVIAGSGALKDEILALRSELGLDERVTLLDYSSEVNALMAASDGLVLASRWEGLPNVILEACIAGLPVVATEVGGVTEIISDGWTGVVVPPEDVGALATGMRRLMQLPDAARREMTLAAGEHVRRAYAPEAVMDVWEGLFLDQLRRRRPT